MPGTKTILWICFVWPEPDSSAAGYRTKQLLEQLKAAGYRVVVSSACQHNSYQDVLNELGIETYNFAANDSSFDDFIRELQPQIVFFDRFMVEEQFSWRVKKECPSAFRILDTIDLHFLRNAREKTLDKNKFCCQLSLANLSEDQKFLRELAAIYRSDLSIVVSDFEFKLLTEKCSVPASLLAVLPWGYPDMGQNPGFDDRKNLVMIGNFNHPPNRDAIEYSLHQLWPEILEVFSTNQTEPPELHIYGAYIPDQFISQHKKHKGVRILGKAENVFETLKTYKLNLAPLRFGAGLKGKVLDGWHVGTPCVASEIAAEGCREGFGGFIAGDKDGFIGAVYDFYTQKDLWVKASFDAAAALKAGFNQESLNAKFMALLNRLSKDSRNYVGQVLWQQQFRSTEYMSRWIEAKNSR